MTNARGKQSYLCPIFPEELIIRGHYNAEYFDYVSVFVNGCELGDECFDDSELSDGAFNFLSVKATPSLTASEDDPEKVVVYNVDQTYIKYLDREFQQEVNIYYM